MQLQPVQMRHVDLFYMLAEKDHIVSSLITCNAMRDARM